MAFYQISEQLKPNDNRVKNINETYDSLPDLPLIKDFYDKYKNPLLLENAKENTRPFEGGFGTPSKPRAGAGTRKRTGTGGRRRRRRGSGEY